jgi:hypothetical protein
VGMLRKMVHEIRTRREAAAPPPLPPEFQFDTTQERVLDHWKSAGWRQVPCNCSRTDGHAHLHNPRKQPSGLVVGAKRHRRR